MTMARLGSALPTNKRHSDVKAESHEKSGRDWPKNNDVIRENSYSNRVESLHNE